MAKEFFDKLLNSSPSAQSTAQGLHILGLSYINMTGTENEIYQASIILTLAHKKADAIKFGL